MTSGQQMALTRPNRMGPQLSRTAMQGVAQFPQKIYEMVNDPANEGLIRWSETGDSFYVLEHERFANEVLPRWFKHKNFSSFVRQLNMYGFHKIPHLQQGVLRSDSAENENWHFSHPNFKRGQPDLLYLIQRKRPLASNEDGTALEQLPTGNQPVNGANLTPSQIMDINSVLNGLNAIRRHQTTISNDLNELRLSNQQLWREAMVARERHKKHQDTINRILKFLAGVFGHGHHHNQTVRKDENMRDDSSHVVIPRQAPMRLMISDGRETFSPPSFNITELRDDDIIDDSMASRFTNVETPTTTTLPSPSLAQSERFPSVVSEPLPVDKQPNTPPVVQEAEASTAPHTPQLPQPITPNPFNVSISPPHTTNNGVNGGIPGNDAAFQAAFSQLLQSPGQIQRLLSQLSSQPNGAFTMPDNMQHDPHPSALDSQALQQYMQIDHSSSSPSPTPRYISQQPPPPDRLMPLLSPPAIDSGNELTPTSSFEPLLTENELRMQKTYKDAAEISHDVNSVSTSINSLIESLGLDPALLASSLPNHAQDMPPMLSSSSLSRPANGETGGLSSGSLAGAVGAGVGHNNHGAAETAANNSGGALDPFRSTPEFDFDAFLTEYPNMNSMVHGIHGGEIDPAAHIASIVDDNDNGVGGGSSITDTTAEQQLAFLDEVASQSDTNSVKTESPELRPTKTTTPSNLGTATIAGRGHKRKSDVAELEDITARMNGSVVPPGGDKFDSSIGQNIKTRKKRQE